MNHIPHTVLNRPLLSFLTALYAYAAFSIGLWLNRWPSGRQFGKESESSYVRLHPLISAACGLLLSALGLLMLFLTPHADISYFCVGLVAGALMAVVTTYLSTSRALLGSALAHAALIVSAILLYSAITVWRLSRPSAILLQGMGLLGVLGVIWSLLLSRVTQPGGRIAWHAFALTVGCSGLEWWLAYLQWPAHVMISLLCVAFAAIYLVVGASIMNRVLRSR